MGGQMADNLTDAQARARIEAMTLQEREALVIQCEEAWRGTPWQWRAELMRSLLNEAKKTIN